MLKKSRWWLLLLFSIERSLLSWFFFCESPVVSRLSVGAFTRCLDIVQLLFSAFALQSVFVFFSAFLLLLLLFCFWFRVLADGGPLTFNVNAFVAVVLKFVAFASSGSQCPGLLLISGEFRDQAY